MNMAAFAFADFYAPVLLPEEHPDTATPTPIFELPTSLPFFGANRRFVPRLRARFSAVLSSGERLCGVDISPGGMLCISETLVWPGNIVEAQIYLAEASEPVQARARVVEIVSYRGELAMRLRFDEVSAAGRDRIAGFMARRAG